MHYVYLLRLGNGKIYTGSTPDLKRRLSEHQNGKSVSTKDFQPIKLQWYCAFPTRLQARQFEAYLKSGSGQAFRNKHLK
ncbi:GIY-YIG nuclease family protein [Candidatus Uhrbacteria bacterium]|jgi:putative endonuclease|nr:GIY-YIG nuclease family protein [Candidatus Uhrbacteria bacterium]MBT7717501.1 GIY-YIG nuclease family protein [Candidatus Uhrbacteria bacterium]